MYSGYPKDHVVPNLSKQYLNMIAQNSIHNYTKEKGVANEDDLYFGTLSTGILQCLLEYTTLPGDIVFTLNAQFGAIYNAAENCGRLVYGFESSPHFNGEALERIDQIKRIGQIAVGQRAH